MEWAGEREEESGENREILGTDGIWMPVSEQSAIQTQWSSREMGRRAQTVAMEQYSRWGQTSEIESLRMVYI